MELKDKVVLVTGSAVRVGRVIALELAKQGANIIVHYNSSADAAQQTVEDIKAFGVMATAVQANLDEPVEIEAMFVTVEQAFGRLDMLVNSASAFERRDLMSMSVEDWNYVMNVNLRAPFICSQRAAHLMLARDTGGLIVNIADSAGVRPAAAFPDHSVSNAGLLMLTQVMAHRLGKEGIRVNAVIPGPVLKPTKMPDERWAELGSHLPIGHNGKAENVAQAVIMIAQNDFMLGAAVVVDGGETLLGLGDMSL